VDPLSAKSEPTPQLHDELPVATFDNMARDMPIDTSRKSIAKADTYSLRILKSHGVKGLPRHRLKNSAATDGGSDFRRWVGPLQIGGDRMSVSSDSFCHCGTVIAPRFLDFIMR